MEHRKFLKYAHRTSLNIGAYMNRDFTIIKAVTEMSPLSRVIFVSSSTCSSCQISTIEEFVKDESDRFEFTVVTDNLESEYLQNQPSVKFLKKNVFKFIDDIGIPGVPFAIGINKAGQIISAGPASSMSDIYEVLSPFFEVDEE